MNLLSSKSFSAQTLINIECDFFSLINPFPSHPLGLERQREGLVVREFRQTHSLIATQTVRVGSMRFRPHRRRDFQIRFQIVFRVFRHNVSCEMYKTIKTCSADSRILKLFRNETLNANYNIIYCQTTIITRSYSLLPRTHRANIPLSEHVRLQQLLSRPTNAGDFSYFDMRMLVRRST